MIPDNEQKTEDRITKKRNESIILIQEEERHRIARDLHDTSLQTLAHLVHKLELCGLYMDAEDMLQAKLELLYVKKNLNNVIEEIRETIFDLRPMQFDDLGVTEAFNRFLEKENADKRFNIRAEIDDVECNSEIVKLTLYRIMQECVTNAIHHSEGTEIVIRGKNQGDFFVLSVSDNGKGFTSQEAASKKDHYGLSVVEERAKLLGGDVIVDSKQGKGTTISIQIPVEELQ